MVVAELLADDPGSFGRVEHAQFFGTDSHLLIAIKDDIQLEFAF
jgi:hypothetical protein